MGLTLTAKKQDKIRENLNLNWETITKTFTMTLRMKTMTGCGVGSTDDATVNKGRQRT